MFEWHFPILNLFSFDCPHVLSYGDIMADIISQKREKGAKKKVPEKNSFYY